MKKELLFIIFLFIFLHKSGRGQVYDLSSPNDKLNINIRVSSTNIDLKMSKNGELIASLSDLRMITEPFLFNFNKVISVNKSSKDEIIIPYIKEKSSSYKNKYNELVLTFQSEASISFRVFDEGVAYRFSSSASDSLTVFDENLTIELNSDDVIRFQANPSFRSAYEQPYETKVTGDFGISSDLLNLPILVQKNSGKFLMVTESDLFHYPGMWFTSLGENKLGAKFPPYPASLVDSENVYTDGRIKSIEPYTARVAANRSFPWRILAVADNENDLIDNNLVYLLASSTGLKDLSWIKPGVAMFDWWGKNNIYGVDFKSGINTETAKYFIDFCAKYGFKYFLFDDGWSQRDNILQPIPNLNLEEVITYAKGKGVDVMLWAIWNTLKNQWNEAFEQFEKWGVKGIKIDFMNRDDQKMVEFFEAVAKKAAEKKMIVDFHGAYKPAGLRRSYPNVLTREALIEFEQSGVSYNDNPEHHNLLPYIRMFTGPMDYIPGTMRNANKKDFKPILDYPMGWGTRAHSMALFIILNSPLTMLPGSPSDYAQNGDCIEFLSRVPVEWDETKLLKGKIGEYTILARRSGKNWYIGGITNDDERVINLNLDFLKPGRYKIEIIEDGENAEIIAKDYRNVIHNIQYPFEDLRIKMASGGGWIAIIAPVD